MYLKHVGLNNYLRLEYLPNGRLQEDKVEHSVSEDGELFTLVIIVTGFDEKQTSPIIFGNIFDISL